MQKKRTEPAMGEVAMGAAVTIPDRLRVAFVGKGGAGKSTISGTFARLLARTGEPVVALDSDPLPGMPFALGLSIVDRPVPDDVVVPGPDGGPRWVLRPGLDAASYVEAHAQVGPDGVRYLQFGNLRGHVSTLQKSQHAWSQVVRELDPTLYHLVGDLPGGTRQPMAGWAKYAEVVCVVVEPSVKSLHSARRLLRLDEATWGPRKLVVVANKVTSDGDAEHIAERIRRQVDCVVPVDPGVLAGDRLGRAPLDVEPAGPLVTAVQGLVAVVQAVYPLDIQHKGAPA